MSDFSFKNFKEIEIPYVTIDIQGNPMNMVVDSGCAVSILSTAALKNCNLTFRTTDKQIGITALTSEKNHLRGITVDFNVGKKQVSETFYIQENDDLGNFKKMHNIELHGLLGSSFLDTNNCKMDYENHCLIIP